MITYTYKREDGTYFEAKQPIDDDPLEECPETGQPCERIISGGNGVKFNADDFYVTDTDGAQNPAA